MLTIIIHLRELAKLQNKVQKASEKTLSTESECGFLNREIVIFL